MRQIVYNVFSTAENVERSIICKLDLDVGKIQGFKDAIENTYWFEFFMGIKSKNLHSFKYLSSLFPKYSLCYLFTSANGTF